MAYKKRFLSTNVQFNRKDIKGIVYQVEDRKWHNYFFFKYGAMNSDGNPLVHFKVALVARNRTSPFYYLQSAIDDRDQVGYVSLRRSSETDSHFEETPILRNVERQHVKPYCIF